MVTYFKFLDSNPDVPQEPPLRSDGPSEMPTAAPAPCSNFELQYPTQATLLSRDLIQVPIVGKP